MKFIFSDLFLGRVELSENLREILNVKFYPNHIELFCVYD